MFGAGEIKAVEACPQGMVFQDPKGSVHPDEPAFCIDKTEVPRYLFMGFLKATFPDEYAVVSRHLKNSNGVALGPNGPAVFVKWEMAQAYCKSIGGDLPTDNQWDIACGGKDYCTTSGNEPSHTEAIFNVLGAADVHGPEADKRVNQRTGVQDMAGNVWEWLRDLRGDGWRHMRGGSWCNVDYCPGYLRADNIHPSYPGLDYDSGGFRCSASTVIQKTNKK
jgi:formylglycine-generating enzyme required for sulfatase activity